MKHRLSLIAIPALLAACGGGGGGGSSTDSAGDAELAQRTAAANTTATGNASCTAIQPFYWEIGDANGMLASNSVGSTTLNAATRLPLASASKWLYSTWYVQSTGGMLDDTDLRFLRFTSGFTSFTGCLPTQTVAECAASGSNGIYNPLTDGKFDYGGGHMQQHAALRGLGSERDPDLATTIRSQLGHDVALDYSQPQLAGGGVSTAGDYARVLRHMLSGQLLMGSLLGEFSVCASFAQCPTEVVSSPAPRGENWRYSIGHWIEDPDGVSDGAYSSPGLFGFYPWIDRTKTWYGVLARYDQNGAIDSVDCGRLIRRAWVTGVAQ